MSVGTSCVRRMTFTKIPFAPIRLVSRAIRRYTHHLQRITNKKVEKNREPPSFLFFFFLIGEGEKKNSLSARGLWSSNILWPTWAHGYRTDTPQRRFGQSQSSLCRTLTSHRTPFHISSKTAVAPVSLTDECFSPLLVPHEC